MDRVSELVVFARGQVSFAIRLEGHCAETAAVRSAVLIAAMGLAVLRDPASSTLED